MHADLGLSNRRASLGELPQILPFIPFEAATEGMGKLGIRPRVKAANLEYERRRVNDK